MKESAAETKVPPSRQMHRPSLFPLPPRMRWYAILGTFLMVVSVFTGVAHASSPSDPPKPYSLPIVEGISANPAYATVNQPVSFYANVTGGIVVGASNPANYLQGSGYHVLWFFGGGNATGDIIEKTDNVPANSGCTSSTDPCTLKTPIQENFTYQVPGSYNVSITVYDSDFNFTIATTTVVVSNAGFSVDITSPCDSPEWPGQSCAGFGHNPNNPFLINSLIEFNAVACTGTCSPPIASGLNYLWDFGDGNTSTAEFNVRHSYARNGTYMVSVTATDSSTGEAARAFLNVTITLLPITIPCGMIVGWPAYGAPGVPVQFSLPANIDPNPDDYANLTVGWSFGDGTTGVGLNTTHLYTSPGTYYPAVTHISNLNIVPPIRTTTCPPPTGSLVINGTLSVLQGKGVTVPVGQVAFPDATHYTNAPAGSALLNYSWSASSGSSYGQIGRISSFTVQNESVGLTVKDPYASSNLQTSTYANFTDVKPTVGVDSLYTEASITVTIGNTYYAQNVTIVLLENGRNVSWYNLWWYDGSVTFYPTDFQMADQWELQENYTPYGGTGSSSVTTEFDWTTDTSAVNAVYHTHTFYNSDPISMDTDNVSINYEALGQWSFLTENLFSPAQTNFSETDDFGFGTPQHFTDPAPTVPEPSLDSYPWEVDWPAGANYTFNITACDAWNLCDSSVITVFDQYGFFVSDLAPAVEAPVQTPAVTAVPGTVNTFVANVTSNVPENASSVVWQFGDGTSEDYGNVGNQSTTTHVYRYGSRYAVIVYAASQLPIPDIVCRPSCYHQAPVSANWSWITVSDIKPEPAFTISNSTPLIDQPVTFNGAHSRENGQKELDNLSFSWDFGDGAIAQGYGRAGDIVSHYYASPGTYTVTLTVQNPDGVSNSTSGTVTVGSTAPTFSFPVRTMTVDSYTVFTPPYPALTSSPFVQATWDWGDGSPQMTGFGVGHTYLKPGNYTATLTLSGGVFGSGGTKSGTVTAKDYPLTVVLPYGNYIAYGENHTESFTAQTLGSYVDAYPLNYSLGFWDFTWQWGDGSSNSSGFSGTGFDSASHPYNLTGNFGLSVSATSPFASAYASTGTGYSSVSSIPDSDGDGLPNAYETAITDTNPYWPDSAAKSASFNGTGLTDYVGPYLAAIGNLTADPDSDGLTSLQEIMGSVTGFPSNPLDANTAGDGIPDGSHFFSESFRNDNVSSFLTGGTGSATNISNVWYAGPAKSFHEAKILVQVNTTASPGQVAVTLFDPAGDPIHLTYGMASYAETFELVNSTPTGGERDNYSGLSLGAFQQKGTWKVEASASGTAGQIVEANIALSYYTNPSRADPTHQGLLQGHGITVPIINCSQPSNVSYPVFNPSTWKITYQPYFPYTEEYYKLSVVQGVPYVPGYNQSVYDNNSNAYSGNCSAYSVSSNLLGDTASYLGDADFGISPWVSDVTGDTQPGGAPLTNGMKALGYANYTLTEDTYIAYQSGSPASSADHGYPQDTLSSYPYSLNPLALSTQYDGAPDGFAVARSGSVSPLSLAITISSATDTNCYDVNSPSDQVSVAVQQEGGSTPVAFTEAHYPSASSSSYTCSFYNNDFNFYDSYTLPLNNSQTEFNLTFTIWHNADPEGDNKWSSGTYIGSVLNGYSGDTGTNPTCGGTCNGVTASWQVEPTPRAPVVFVGNAGETQMLPGYGLHYVGEQQFYGFYLSVTGSSSGPNDPFQPGGSQGALNVLLLSRASYLETNVSTNLSANTLAQNLPALASCLGNSQVTTRDSGGSHLSLAGTLAATMSDSCANLLLQNLMPRNSTGNVTGTYFALGTTQLQLLGFDTDASQVAPFLPIPGFNSQLGGLPSGFDWNFFAITGGAIVAVGNFFHQPAIVAVGNWVQGLQAAVAQAFALMGQIVVGIWNAVVSTVEAVVAAAISVLNVLLSLALAIGKAFLNAVVNGFLTLVHGMVSSFALSFLSFLADTDVGGTPILTASQFAEVYSKATGGGTASSESSSASDSDFGNLELDLIAISVAAYTGALALNIAMLALTAGTWSEVRGALSFAGDRLIDNAISDLIFGVIGLAAGLAIFYAINSGALQGPLEAIGFSAGGAATVEGILSSWEVVGKLPSKRYQNLPQGKNAFVGLMVSVMLVVISGVLDIFSQLIDQVANQTGDSTLRLAAEASGFLGGLIGIEALGFLTLPVVRVATDQMFPVPIIVLIVAGFTSYLGMQQALSNGGSS